MRNDGNFQSVGQMTYAHSNENRNSVVNNNVPMNETLIQAETPYMGVQEQPVNGNGVVDPENKTIKEEGSTVPDAKAEKNSKKVAKTSIKKDYKPAYEEADLAHLTDVTKKCEEEITRVINDSRYYATPYADGKNCLIDLRKAYFDGKIQFVSPMVNRNHGADEKKTGESMLTYGAQHILIVMTVAMANAAGLLPKRFKNDKSEDPILDDALVMMDGNGRIDFLMDIDQEDWPEIYAVFPTKDKAGYYNLNKSFDIINTQVSVWKSQDMVQKRRLMDGDSAHPGWAKIDELVKAGYMYQSACQLVTLGVDRIKKAEVTNGDDTEIFKFYDYAIQIYEALKAKFGEGKDKTLKTKVFTQEVSILWKKLNDAYNEEEATKYFLDFLDQLDDNKVKAIKEAESDKGGATRDEKRKQDLEKWFNRYVGANTLTVD